MKSLKIMMAIAAVAMAVILSGCSKEANKDPFPGVKDGWTESGNTMTYKTTVVSTKADDTYTLYYLFTLKFNGETCTSAIWELGCPDAQIAADCMTELKKELGNDPEMKKVLDMISISGRIIKVDMTSIFSLIPKSMIKQLVENMAKGY